MTALEQRKQAIEKCIAWVNEFGQNNSDYYSHVIDLNKISFDIIPSTPTADTNAKPSPSQTSSYCPPMVGVYAKQNIKQGDILFTIPEACILSERHPLLADLASEVVDKAMAVYQDYKTNNKDLYSPWDPYYKFDGRIIVDDELRLALHLTLLLFAHSRQRQMEGGSGNTYGESLSTSSTLEKAAKFWAPYFDTLPENYESLIFHWTMDEVENLKGTTCYALVQRLRQEVQENWEHSFQDVLVEYLMAEEENSDQGMDRELLYSCYRDAICVMQSRVHALDVLSGGTVTAQNNNRCTCPLGDLLNGDREGNPRCSTHLLHYPGSHMALQATRDVVAGEEVIVSYAQGANQTIVSKFGFLPLSKEGNPLVDLLDTVYILPKPQFVWEESDPRWKALTSAQDGKSLRRNHVIENPPFLTAELGSPFALIGDKLSMGKVRTSETWKPHYLTNFHFYAMLWLTKDEDLNRSVEAMDPYIEPWEPGAIIMEMIDHRLMQLPTQSLAKDKLLLESQMGNFKTGTLYRMLEREILHMWRHAIAKHYDVYGEANSEGEVFQPLSDGNEKCCAACHASLALPLKCCTQCRVVYYCSRGCQKEDWKAGHKQSCRPIKP